jgi:hypothetical protein
MNKWIRRAVGTVGIAGGALLLGTGTAQADDSVTAAQDPQLLHGLVEDLFSPTGGPGLSLDTPGHRTTAGLRPGGLVQTSGNQGEVGVVLHAPDGNGERRDLFVGGRPPDVFNALPVSDVVPVDGLGLRPAPVAAPQGESLRGESLPVPDMPVKVLPALDGLPLGGLPLGGLPLGGLPLGGLPLGGLPLGGLPVGGLPLGGDPLGAATGAGQETRGVTDAAAAVVSGDVVHVLPPGGSLDDVPEALPLGGLPVGDLPILNGVLADGLPLGGVGGLPLGAAPAPGGQVGDTGPSDDLTAERPAIDDPQTESLPLGGLPLDGLPLGGLPLGGLPLGGLPLGGLPLGGLPVGGLPLGGLPVGGLPLGGLPVGGLPLGGLDGLPLGGLPLGGLPLGGLDNLPLPLPGTSTSTMNGTDYTPRHAAPERPVAGE